MRVSGARTPLGELHSRNTSPALGAGESVTGATSKIPSAPSGCRTGENCAVPLLRERKASAPPSPKDSEENTTSTGGSHATPAADGQASKLPRPTATPSSLPAKLSRFAPASHREAHRKSQGAANAEQRRAGGKRSRLASRASRDLGTPASDSGDLKSLLVTEPVCAQPPIAFARTPPAPSAAQAGPPASVSRIPSCPTISSARRTSAHSSVSLDGAASTAADSTRSNTQLPERISSETPPRNLVAPPVPEPAVKPFGGKLYGNELYESSPQPQDHLNSWLSASGNAEPSLELPSQMRHSLSDWLPVREVGAPMLAASQMVAESPPSTLWVAGAALRAAMTPEAQVADVLGLFDMGSFNFDTPPEDYSDVTPGFLQGFGKVAGPNLQSFQDWCHSTGALGASEGSSAGIVDGPACPDGVSLAFSPAGAPESGALQPPVQSMHILMAELPLTPGGGIESPAARLLLSAMRPGWTLDPAAGISTPYVEQLLRTLPVLTPHTGSELDGSRLLSALEARPELLAGLQAELHTRDVAACIRQLASPLTGVGLSVAVPGAGVPVFLTSESHKGSCRAYMSSADSNGLQAVDSPSASDGVVEESVCSAQHGISERLKEAPSALVVLTPVVAGAARGQGSAAQQPGQCGEPGRRAELVLSLATPATSPPLPVGRLSFGQGKLVRTGEPAANTPYRLMMRHLLGGAYDSPCAQGPPRSPDSCSATSPATASDPHCSPLRESSESRGASPSLLSFTSPSACSNVSDCGPSPGSSTAAASEPLSPLDGTNDGRSDVDATASTGGSLSLDATPSAAFALNPAPECLELGPPATALSPVNQRLGPVQKAASVPADHDGAYGRAASPLRPGAALPAVRISCSSALAMSPGSCVGTPNLGAYQCGTPGESALGSHCGALGGSLTGWLRRSGLHGATTPIRRDLKALWTAAGDAKSLRAQLERVHRASAEIADVEAEDAEHWERLVEERDQLAAENAALAAELAPLCAQLDGLLLARAAYTDAPAHDVAIISEELQEAMGAQQELLAQAEDARTMAAFFQACSEPGMPPFKLDSSNAVAHWLLLSQLSSCSTISPIIAHTSPTSGPKAENVHLGGQLAAARARLLVMNGAYDVASAASHVGSARAADLERQLTAARDVVVAAEAAGLQADANATSAAIEALQRDNLLLRASLDALRSQTTVHHPSSGVPATPGDAPWLQQQQQQQQTSAAHWVGSPSPAEAESTPLPCATLAPCEPIYDEPRVASDEPIASLAGPLLLAPESSPAAALATAAAPDMASDTDDDDSATEYASLYSTSEAGSSLNLADISTAAAAVLTEMATPPSIRADSEQSVWALTPGHTVGSPDKCALESGVIVSEGAAAADDTAATATNKNMAVLTHDAALPCESAERLVMTGGMVQSPATELALADIHVAAQSGASATPQKSAAGLEAAEVNDNESDTDDGYASAEEAATPVPHAHHRATRSPSLGPSLAHRSHSPHDGAMASEMPVEEAPLAGGGGAVPPAKSALARVGTPVSAYSPGAIIREGGIPAAVALFSRIAATAYGASKLAHCEAPAVESSKACPGFSMSTTPAGARPAAPLCVVATPAQRIAATPSMEAGATSPAAAWAAVTARLNALRVELRLTQLRLESAEKQETTRTPPILSPIPTCDASDDVPSPERSTPQLSTPGCPAESLAASQSSAPFPTCKGQALPTLDLTGGDGQADCDSSSSEGGGARWQAAPRVRTRSTPPYTVGRAAPVLVEYSGSSSDGSTPPRAARAAPMHDARLTAIMGQRRGERVLLMTTTDEREFRRRAVALGVRISPVLSHGQNTSDDDDI